MFKWICLLVAALVCETAISFDLFQKETKPNDWEFVKSIPGTTTVGNCEFQCFLDGRCERWVYLRPDHSCFLTSARIRLNSIPLVKSVSEDSDYDVFQGLKSNYKKHVDRLVQGPLATGKSSYVNFSRKFYKGCSYTISMWVWLYKTEQPVSKSVGRPKELALFSTYPSLPLFESFEALLPAVVFNIGTNTDKLFFSTGKDKLSDYKGAWGDNIEYEKWLHISMVISPSSFTPYVNGEMVRPPVSMESGICPFLDGVDMSVRSTEELEDLKDDFALSNLTKSVQNLPHNTIFGLSNSKSAAPLFGIYSAVDIFSGKELTMDQINILYETSRAHVAYSLPSLPNLVNHYKNMKKSHGVDISGNEYAMMAYFGKLPLGRIYGSAVCVNGLDNSFMADDMTYSVSNAPKKPPVSGADDNEMSYAIQAELDANAMPVSQVFILNFAVGSRKFPYSYSSNLSSLENAAQFCEQEWKELSEAFVAAEMAGIDMKACIDIVVEVTYSQAQHAIQFGPQGDLLSEFDAPNSGVNNMNEEAISPATDNYFTSPSDLSSGSPFEGSTASDSSAVEAAVGFDAYSAILDENSITTPLSPDEIEEYLSGLNENVMFNKEQIILGDERLTDVSKIILEDEKLKGDGYQGNEYLKASTAEFLQLLAHIETMLYSHDVDDGHFYKELDLTIIELERLFYADEDIDQGESELFYQHLNDLSVVFDDDVAMTNEISQNHLDRFEDALDNLYDDIIRRDRNDQTDKSDKLLDAVVDFRHDALQTETITPKRIESNAPADDGLHSPKAHTYFESTASPIESSSTINGNLDSNFDAYNEKIRSKAQFSTSNSSSSSIEITEMKIIPNSTDFRVSLEKQMASLEIKMVLEEHLRNPFHRQKRQVVPELNASFGEDIISEPIMLSTTFYDSLNVILANATKQFQYFTPILDNTVSLLNRVKLALISFLECFSFVSLGNVGYDNSLENITSVNGTETAMSDGIANVVDSALQSKRVQEYLDKYQDEKEATTALDLVNTSLTHALESIYLAVLPTNSKDNPVNFTDMLTFVGLEALIEGVLLQIDHIGSGSLSLEWDIFEDDRIKESTRLYDAAMQWIEGKNVLHGRYGDSTNENKHLLLRTKHTVFNERIASEAAESSLIIAMWLSDELEMEHPLLSGGGGMFQGCGMLGQPSRMALGYRHSLPLSSAFLFAGNEYISSFLSDGQAGDNRIASSISANVDSLLGRIIPIITENDTVYELDQSVVSVPEARTVHEILVRMADMESDVQVGRMGISVGDTAINNTKSDIQCFTSKSNAECFATVVNRTISSHPGSEDHKTCSSALAYYFPVMQYVSANYGSPESGVKHPEVFRLSDLGPIGDSFSDIVWSVGVSALEWMGRGVADGGNFAGGLGGGDGTLFNSGGPETALEGWEGSSTNAYYEVEAAEGNAEAQVWLGVRHYWGSSGYASNTTLARHYFELAAKQNNGEALYCLGALYENGQGGLSRNTTKAMELFIRAANLSKPHPAALQVLGAHYHKGPMADRNLTLAKYYYEKSAELGESSGYYSLGNLYREGFGRKMKQPSSNNTESNKIIHNIPLALHFLAKAASHGHTRALSTLAHAFSDAESWLGHYFREQEQKSFHLDNNISMNKSSEESVRDLEGDSLNSINNNDNEEILELFSRWGFNASQPIKLILPNGAKVLLPVPFKPSCDVALPMLKYLAEFSYRPNDLSSQALELFLTHDYVGSITLFDEAAELGLESAQLNSAFLYKYFLSSPLLMPDICQQMIEATDNRQHCETHLHNMYLYRLIQLASSNSPEGYRELGDYLLSIATSNVMLDGVENMDGYITLAGKVYAHSALNHKDITSLMSLANLIRTGDLYGIRKNISLAKELYHKALEWEMGGNSFLSKKNKKDETQKKESSGRVHEVPKKVYTYNDMGATTGGVAPAVALMRIHIDELFTRITAAIGD